MDNKKIVYIISSVVFIIIISILLVVLIKNNKSSDNEELYVVTIDNDGKEEKITGKLGDKIRLETHYKEGYTFLGYYDKGSKENNYYYDEYIITGNVTLVVLYVQNEEYTITFVNEEGVILEPISVYYNEKIDLPIPKKEGYTFSHYVDEDGIIFNYTEYPYNKNITLKAVWIKNEIKKYTIKFDTDGGNNIDNQLVVENDKIMKPNNPKKDGYCFLYWEYNYNKYDFNNKVKNNITLKAKYDELFSINKDIFNLIKLNYKDLSNKFGIKESTIRKQKIVSTNKGNGYSADGSILYKNGYYAYYNFFTFSNQNYNNNLNKQTPKYIVFKPEVIFNNYKRDYINESNLKCLGYTSIKYVKDKKIYKFNYGKYIIEIYDFNTDKERVYVWNIN